jgi:translation initiation factor eIF-2B subunit gamma
MDSGRSGLKTAEFQAVVMAGGFGNRMYPLTYGFPKCLLPIANRPLLLYPLEILERAGFNQAIVVTEASIATPVKAFIEEEYKGQLKIDLVVLEKPMGTADALRHPAVRSRITTDFFVMSGDLITNVFLQDLAYVHRSRDSAVTFLLHKKHASEAVAGVKPTDDTTDSYIFGLNESTLRVLLFRSASDVETTFDVNKSLLRRNPNLLIHSGLMDSHLYLFSHWILQLLVDKPRISCLQAELLPELVARQFSKRLEKYQTNPLGESLDTHSWTLGTKMNHSKTVAKDSEEVYRCFAVLAPDNSFCYRANTVNSYMEMNREIGSGQQYEYIPWKPLDEDSLQAALKANPSAQIGQSVIGKNLSCGAQCSVKKSILGHNIKIGNRVKLATSVIHSDVTIGDDVSLLNCVVCKGCVIGPRSSFRDCKLGMGYCSLEGQDAKNETLVAEGADV